MGAITQGFYDRLSNDSTLTALLGTYKSAPSILTQRPTPPGFGIVENGPYVLTTGETVSIPGMADVKNAGGREVLRDIYAFAQLNTDPAVLESIAERIRALFHRAASAISISGFSIAFWLHRLHSSNNLL